MKLSQTEEKVTKLIEDLAQESKTAKDTPNALQNLMFSIENLGDNTKNMNEEMIFCWDTEVMETKEELATLANPVSLLELAKSPPSD